MSSEESTLSPVTWPSDVEWVTPDELRIHFNTADFVGGIERGEILEGVWKDRHLPQPRHEPYCTRSQMVIYWTEQREPVALVHQYLRPDGSLGASRQPDPKRIVVGDKVYATKG